ncbi:hypothetical protein ATANTOWER_020503 [Ataeniobius toweri]|uniref:Uncharacterized protein n=1 Tax=Ataeniobius toweri TaxID=208326 RepID=A0ABU7A7D9_9TELE|nr:hypothetical protein [Ataeniobius toweri]
MLHVEWSPGSLPRILNHRLQKLRTSSPGCLCKLLPIPPACPFSNYYWEDTFGPSGPLAHRLCPRTPEIFATGKPQT